MQRLLRPVAFIVVAAVAGFLIARELDPPHRRAADALTRAAPAGLFAVRYPGDWTAVAPRALTGLSLGRRIALGPTRERSERLQIGTAHAATLGALPTAFLHSLSHRPTPEVVALGPYHFDRYLDLRPRGAGRVVSVYLLATTRATIVATCESPRPDDTFTGACERILRTLRLARGVKIEAAVDAAYALELNEILATLNEARRADGPGLLASGLDTRAHSATRLAAAESRAAHAASRLPAGFAVSVNDTLVAALRQAADGYRALASAAGARDRARYEAAQGMLRAAQGRLTEAFKGLARLGYRLQ